MSAKIRYSDLSFEQKSIICNGCGTKGWIKPPKNLFQASCDQHDFYYWRGGDEIDRYEADIKFYMMMLQDAHDSGKYFRRRVHAWLYYRMVRLFGHNYFSYGPMKDREDVEISSLMKEI